MKLLAFAFWSIIIATGLRLCLFLAVFSPRVILLVFSARLWLALAHPIHNLLFYLTPLYYLSIGYILLLFNERKWIVWGSYTYVIGFVLNVLFFRNRVPEDGLSSMYWMSVLCVSLPNIICGICWLCVSVRPMAPYYRALGGIYLVLFSSSATFFTLFLYTQDHAWNRAIYIISPFISLPILPLIARARRELKERAALEREIFSNFVP